MRTIKFTPVQKAAFVLATILLLLTISSGPYFAQLSNQNQRNQLTKISDSQAGIHALLNFVAQVSAQGGGGNAATTWYVLEMQAICQATPGCKQVPLPAGFPTTRPRQVPTSTTTTVP